MSIVPKKVNIKNTSKYFINDVSKNVDANQTNGIAERKVQDLQADS